MCRYSSVFSLTYASETSLGKADDVYFRDIADISGFFIVAILAYPGESSSACIYFA